MQGSNFTSSSVVSINGSPRQTSFQAAGRLTANLVAGDLSTPGQKQITVANGGGPASLAAVFTVAATGGGGGSTATPVLTSVVPPQGDSAGGYTRTLNGANFAPGISVRFGGNDAVSVVVDPTSGGRVLTATVPSHPAGVVTVSVKNPGQAAWVDVPNAFTYLDPAPVGPTITGISPSSGLTNTTTQVTISGSGFQQNAALTFGGITAPVLTVAASGLSMTVLAPPHAAGPVDVWLNQGSGTTVLTGGFTYNPPSAPPGGQTPWVVQSISPAGSPTAGNQTVVISGSQFPATGITATIGNRQYTPAVNAAGTTLTFTTQSTPVGVYDVEVSSVTPAQTTIMGQWFVFSGPPPAVTSVTPSLGFDKGTYAGCAVAPCTISISGSNFVNGATVSFGGIAATGVTVLNSSTISAVLPSHVAGPVEVSVANPGQTAAVLTNGFTYKLTAPTALTHTGRATTSISVTWTDNADHESAYKVVTSVAGSNVYVWHDAPANSTSYTIPGLTPDTAYYIWVYAYSGANYSAEAGVLIDYTDGGSTPATPTNHLAGVVTASQIQTVWTDNATNEQTYIMAYTRQDNISYQFVELPANSTSWTHTNPGAGTTWLYFVQACRLLIQCSPWSAGVAVTAAPTPPTPVNLMAGQQPHGRSNYDITLSWQPGAGPAASTYKVVWAPANTSDYHWVDSGPGTSWTHDLVLTGAVNDYWVQACNGTQCSAFADAVRVTAGGGSGPLAAGPASATATPSPSVTPQVTPVLTPQATLSPAAGRTAATGIPVPLPAARPVDGTVRTPVGILRGAGAPGDPPPPPVPPNLPPPGVVPPLSALLAFLQARIPVPPVESFPPPPIDLTPPVVTPTPAPTATATATVAATPSPSATPSLTPTTTPSPSATATPSPTSTATATTTPAATGTPAAPPSGRGALPREPGTPTPAPVRRPS